MYTKEPLGPTLAAWPSMMDGINMKSVESVRVERLSVLSRPSSTVAGVVIVACRFANAVATVIRRRRASGTTTM